MVYEVDEVDKIDELDGREEFHKVDNIDKVNTRFVSLTRRENLTRSTPSIRLMTSTRSTKRTR